ncbi:nitrilase-related carbon-nitrogen hydrolase [Aliarcobacter cryaerophilus]|uniref:Nitrilase-related carbon-nitrogen hydrolase n=2 Tax=unclassified Arcobacter TaxID=2593671 RepID=A0AA96I7N4_9BACT|nr:nitrilase-related carbon-nitrogen hydrolase [Arcobacter sp. AZ-2023]WPD09111.1 nitrilase-related carbon-nitrogen hydrolase [Arcobacter sp. DSM 115954]WNL13942.1 nitrilase-related carbon-nitrogen hydrolase [Arcobacter sp. AZ-2023]WNL20177.1 nitrilase-related carbon-nitrogen hydrolase [Arcobacter sp. AZ-2023]WNL22319.1 nitrilase-related carbon-nitrogen hydrolase [Arcobacter sp. AZ-2023]
MKLSLVSIDQFWEDKKLNLDLCKKYIQNASSKKLDLIIFPEMTLTGFSNNISLIAEDFEKSETIKQFSNLAKEFNISIIFGVVVEDNEKALNKCLFIDNFGNILSDYSKIHPFSFSGEDKFFNPGNKLSIVEFKKFKIGLTICYDLRFPELYSSLAKECDLIINIANWPSKRVDHWNTLLKARAIENQIFVAGINRTGKDGNKLEYIESSKIFNANGEELEFEKDKKMKIYNLSKTYTNEFKKVFNTINDRKVGFYKEIL